MRLVPILLAILAAGCTSRSDPEIAAQCERDGMGSRSVCQCFGSHLGRSLDDKAYRAMGLMARGNEEEAETIMKAMTGKEAGEMLRHTMDAMDKCRPS